MFGALGRKYLHLYFAKPPRKAFSFASKFETCFIMPQAWRYMAYFCALCKFERLLLSDIYKFFHWTFHRLFSHPFVFDLVIPWSRLSNFYSLVLLIFSFRWNGDLEKWKFILSRTWPQEINFIIFKSWQGFVHFKLFSSKFDFISRTAFSSRK